MKHILFRLILLFIICTLFLSRIYKGKKTLINYNFHNLINSIKVEPGENEYFFQNPLRGIGNFYLDCEPGDKIILNATRSKTNIIKNHYFYMKITFDDDIKYIYNKNNISLINDPKTSKYIYAYLFIPFETYCKDQNNIIINENSNDIINIDLTNNIFINYNSIQSKDRLSLNITEIFPLNINFKINKNIISIFQNNNINNIKTPIEMKYIGTSITGGGKPLNECSLKIMHNNYLLNDKNDEQTFLRKLNSTSEAEEQFYFYSDNMYNNSNALKHIKTIERFFSKGMNIFNLSEPIFNDLCIYVSENGSDVVLLDRISLYFQNYSICNSNCIISEIDLENYNYVCKCSNIIVLTNDDLGKAKVIDENSFSKETLSEEISDIFFETNFEVLSCFLNLIHSNIFLHNFGAIMTTAFLTIQLIAGLFLFKQIKDIRSYLYKEVIKNPNPPKRRNTGAYNEEIQKQIESGSNNIKINDNLRPKDLFKNSVIGQMPKNKRKIKFDASSELSSRKALLNYGKRPKVFDNMIDEKNNNNFLFNSKLGKSVKINQPVKKIYPLPKGEQKIKEIDFPFFESENSSQRKMDKKNLESIYSPKHKIPRINKHSVVYIRKNYNKKYDENELKDYLNSQKTLPPNKFEENRRYTKKTNNKKENKDEYEFNDEKNFNNEKENKNEKDNEGEKDINEKEFQLEQKFNFISNNDIIKIPLVKDNYKKKQIVSEYYAQDTERDNKKDTEKEKPKVKLRKCKTKKSVDSRKRRLDLGDSRKKDNKSSNSVQIYGKKEYDEDDLNEMDFDEAVLFDKRGFCELFWMEMKERQLIINTFFVKEKLKPFSIKLIVFIFSITCYFVINGFLYDTTYVSKKLKRTGKSVYFFFVDSIKRIIYSSLVGVLVNLIVGLLFRSDKTLRKAQIKYKDNIVILNGEVVKIFKNMKITNFLFTVVNFILMVGVWIYLFCFCGVYPNCQMDWVESAGIIIGVMQFLPVLISILLSLLRIIGLRCGMESCFRITSWISDNT